MSDNKDDQNIRCDCQDMHPLFSPTKCQVAQQDQPSDARTVALLFSSKLQQTGTVFT